LERSKFKAAHYLKGTKDMLPLETNVSISTQFPISPKVRLNKSLFLIQADSMVFPDSLFLVKPPCPVVLSGRSSQSEARSSQSEVG